MTLKNILDIQMMHDRVTAGSRMALNMLSIRLVFKILSRNYYNA